MMVDGGDVYISRQIPGGWGYVVRPDVPNQRNLQFAVTGGGPLDLIALNSGTTFTTGKLGIFNNAPVADLDIYLGGAASLQPGVFIHSGSFVNGANAQASYFIKAQDDGNSATQFIVHGDGSTGISSEVIPGYKLSVNGSGIFTRVVVRSNIGADYVFDSTYRLLPLKDLRQYLKDNHHLPDIPSADSMLTHGLDLGVNQTALLKKIEELTLYAIAQEEQLQKSSRQLQQQKDDHEQQMKAMQDRIDRLERLIEDRHK
jgi:DNA-binding transcriptional MerR regulator